MTEIQPGRARSGHFSEEDCVDFARRQGGDQHGLEQHLAAGCRRCGRTLSFWEAVHGLAVHESSYRPPKEVVAKAKAEFALRRPAVTTGLATTASLIFDSLRQPLPVGIRTVGPAPLQMVYKAGHYLIMVRVEPTAGSDRLSVVGQIMDEANPKRSLKDLAVVVLKGGETVEHTLTNQLGEFQLESEHAESIRISIGAEIESLTVPLPFGEVGTSAQPARVAGASGNKSGRKTPGKTVGKPVRKAKARHA
jgi:hypothetical protein